jgi:hypothetical protein
MFLFQLVSCNGKVTAVTPSTPAAIANLHRYRSYLPSSSRFRSLRKGMQNDNLWRD